MKKLILAAAAFTSFATANAQSDVSNIGVNLNLVEIIELLPNNLPFGIPAQSATGTINEFSEYSNGIWLSETGLTVINPPITGPGEFEFTVGASNGYKVEVKTSGANFSGPDADMSTGCIGLQMDGTYPTGAVVTSHMGSVGSTSNRTGGLSATNKTIMTHPTGHAPAAFGFDLNARPGYGFNGGSYSTTVVVTATLD